MGNDIRVLRAKSRLTSGYDSVLSAGYRDIVLNLPRRLTSEKAAVRGVDRHVYEVQLLHKLLAALKVHNCTLC